MKAQNLLRQRLTSNPASIGIEAEVLTGRSTRIGEHILDTSRKKTANHTHIAFR